MDTEAIQTGIKFVQTVWEQICAAPSHLLLILFLFILGMFIKSSPINNRLIPWIMFALGTGAYPFIAEPTLTAYQRFPNPKLVLCGYGFILAFGAIAAHVFLKRFEKFRDFEARLVGAFSREETKQNAQNETSNP